MKLPKGYSVKTIAIEKGLIELYRWVIFKDGILVKESHTLDPDRLDARNTGVKFLHKNIDSFE